MAGREADAQLSRWLEIAGEHLADWVESDPVRASAFTREAGSAVLLMRESFPELDELSRRVGPAVVDAGGGEGFAVGQPAPLHHHAGLGPGGHTLHLDGLGLDFGGLLDLGGGLGDFGGGGDGGGGGGGDGGGGGGH